MGMTMQELSREVANRILEHASDGILLCDAAGTIRYWNRGAERIFGFDRSEAIGASLDLIIPERLRARHWAGWRSAIASGSTRYADGQLLNVPAVHKNASQLSIEFSIQLLKDAAGRVEWVVAIIRDVTERYRRDKAMHEELKRLRSTSVSNSGS